MRVRVGISTPWDLWDLEPEQQRARLAAIADGGIDHVFTADHVSFVGGHGIDGLTHLAAIAGLEPRLDLEVGVMLLALRHPMVAARQIASLAQVAPGRLTVGVGVGGEDRHEFEVCEVDPATRGARTDVAMLLVRRLLEGETVDGDGTFFDFETGRIRPTPATRVPFVVGGRSDAALSRVARLGDGWLATWCSPKRFAEGTAKIAATATDRRVSWRHGLQAWIGVGDTPAEGRSHVATAMERFYGLNFELFERYTPVGTPEQIASFLARYVEAGASVLNLTPCGPSRKAEADAVIAIRDLLRA
jgi:alkanesulfonate monooxygenase SsuD/methylene tetrahydromethanopterin reductase-like flavin-dependent oxidoreductase (luciferase family)